MGFFAALGIVVHCLLTLASISLPTPVLAMTFITGGTDHRSYDAKWIQASGIIDENTVEDFLAFLATDEFHAKRVRFDSPGGNLMQGVLLGLELRKLGFATEIGGHEPDPDWPDMPYWDFTRRTPGFCASACAYAFLGGIERRIDPGSRIGFHQFYNADLEESDVSGKLHLVEEGFEQEMVGILLGYVLDMGIDGRVLVHASFSNPEEMYWIEQGDEAYLSNLIYDPRQWKPWDVNMLGRGVIAESGRADGKYKMAAFCTQDGGSFLDIFFAEEADGGTREWLSDQCLPAGSSSQGPGMFNIVGNHIAYSNIRLVERPGGFALRFSLGHTPVASGSASFLYDDAPMGACFTDNLIGTEMNLTESVSLAFRNCIQ
jgi:hypothetical protein